ncbi:MULTISPECIES: hypothetical protein [Kordiimonas]|uniref:hypothetical protein n=1 Tax=Kordiimonas TaxID=288021 RepID=UPI0025807808|nr:hypothetical protein [Kordiimonas sp. UBA4487]
MKKLITTAFAACMALTLSAAAQEENSQPSQQDQTVRSIQYLLKRAELVRMLSAQHLIYIDDNRDKDELHLMDDAAQVMAFSLVCQDPSFDPATLNKIAAESTLQIALKVEGSPIEEAITDAMGELQGKDRITLIADVSSNVLMFKIGRRRGLFDALLTDFGTARFCKGMGSNMRARYQGLATHFKEMQPEKSSNERN